MEIINDLNFDEKVLKAEKPVLVDFFASWCGPCRQMLPIVGEIAEEMHDTLQVFKVDVDESPKKADSFNIQSIPALFLFKNGAMVASHSGALSKNALIEWIKNNI